MMSKVAVVFWSGTGNTEAMANQVVEGAKRKGAEVDLFTAAEFEKSLVATYDAIAFGCPSMGVEQLEDGEFEPMFEVCLPKLEEWESTCSEASANLVCQSVICNDYPDKEALDACYHLGQSLVK